MNIERYDLKAGKDFATFEFISIGTKGQIVKLIQFTRIENFNAYNLAFGDKNNGTDSIDDTVISNNGDSDKVLATIVSAIYAFTDKHRESWIYATGSTRTRNRLYRIGISKYLSEAKRDFELLGLLDEEWEVFRLNVEYEAFLIKRK